TVADAADKDKAGAVGKIIPTNDDDIDDDGIPDYADGWNADVNAFGDPSPKADDDQASGERFVPMTITLPDTATANLATIRIDYDDSPPDGVQRSGAGTPTDPYLYQPGPGTLRVWLKPGDARRNGEPIV